MAATDSPLLIQRTGDVQIIEFVDTRILDQLQIDRIKNEILKMIEDAGHPKFLINFENVKYISSAVLGMLMTVNKAIVKEKGELRLAGIDKSLMEVFKLTRLDKILKIYDKPADALHKFIST